LNTYQGQIIDDETLYHCRNGCKVIGTMLALLADSPAA
jgi:hypothetical protein